MLASPTPHTPMTLLTHTHTPWCQVALPLVSGDFLCQLMTSEAFIIWPTKESLSLSLTHTREKWVLFLGCADVFLTQILSEVGATIGDLVLL